MRTSGNIARLATSGFVWTPDRALLGKLLGVDADGARVRIVRSSVSIEERVYDPTILRRAFLSPQTRVYVADEESEALLPARVVDYDVASVVEPKSLSRC